MQHKVKVEYHGHSYEYYYSWAGLYCPSCSKQTVYQEIGEGDYYVGPNFVCTSCKNSFTLQGPSLGDERDIQIIEQILADADDKGE